MKITRSASGLLGLAMLLWTADTGLAQSPPEVRRARPIDEPPVARALPLEEPPTPVPRRSAEEPSEPAAQDTEAPDRRQLDYANALFTRKLYDLAVPEYQKYLDDYPGRSGRANAYFSLGECSRNLNRPSNARTNFQKVLSDYGDSEFAGPAAYALAEMAFTQKDYAAALPLFHRSAAKSKESAVALSARYFEARCLEILGRKDEASDIYQEVAATGNPNPYREDARLTAASILVGRGRKIDALKQYEALSNETQKPTLKAEADVRAVMIALDLVQADKGKIDKAEELYRQIIAKYPDREEAKDAAYQRLINIYNSDPSTLLAEVEEFLKTNPTGERADQVKLLKAEALYKQQNYTEAVPIYAELRASQLSPKLRAESAYKLGLCYVQTKNTSALVEAFTYYLQTFPDNPQVPAVLAQRALAYEQDKNYNAALSDLDIIITKYLSAREREAALQMKALILGQQENAKGMSDTFRQLLKEYPKSPVAAQAQYYIGKAAFEAKDYKTAMAALNAARQLNKEQFYNLATLRLILCQFYLKDRPALTKEVNNFMVNSPNVNPPPEVLEWLGIEYFNEKNYETAEKYLSALGKIDNRGSVKPDFWFYLGDAATKLKNLPEAEDAFGKYLQTAKDPAGKAKVLLALGAVKIGAHKVDDAQKIAEEIMSLQPEGRVSAEARLLGGTFNWSAEILMMRARFSRASLCSTMIQLSLPAH